MHLARNVTLDKALDNKWKHNPIEIALIFLGSKKFCSGLSPDQRPVENNSL